MSTAAETVMTSLEPEQAREMYRVWHSLMESGGRAMRGGNLSSLTSYRDDDGTVRVTLEIAVAPMAPTLPVSASPVAKAPEVTWTTTPTVHGVYWFRHHDSDRAPVIAWLLRGYTHIFSNGISSTHPGTVPGMYYGPLVSPVAPPLHDPPPPVVESPAWTRERPTRDGEYWHRSDSDSDSVVVVHIRSGYVRWPGVSTPQNLALMPTHQNEWCGPITPPAAPDHA